jgi:hypothetical protein
MALLNITSFRGLVKELQQLNKLIETYLLYIGVPLNKEDGKGREASVEYVDEEENAILELKQQLGKLTEKERRKMMGEEE